ncbi:MAG TPA: hypothetical protein VKT70_16200 [Stellaceae bacterium]|nr:hypothetical protein [Stellaceae bacterium]
MERFSITTGSSRWAKGRWQVRHGDQVYSGYLSLRDALLDAVDAAEEAVGRGHDAEIWIEEHGRTPRLQWSSAKDE